MNVTSDQLLSIGFKLNENIWHDERGSKNHESNTYILNEPDFVFTIRYLFKESVYLIWVKYNFRGINLNCEQLKFYDRQFIKRTENLTFENVKLLLLALCEKYV